ncbi:MAG: ADP-ribosylglycohydrolase family protein, partial [Bryobacteraceae bacterium]|nr:ADP-ribosylglycohydrolase family protein [Bryobacteraceae bacterium]
ARTGRSKEAIRREIENRFGYDLSRTCGEIRPAYGFHESCQRTVPEAITAFLESSSFESAVRLAVSLGGDSDTLACITGGIAQAFYGGVPPAVEQMVYATLDDGLRSVTKEFIQRFVSPA